MACPKKRRVEEKMVFFKKKCSLWIEMYRKKKAGEVNDCRQIRISECENVFVLAGQAGAELETSRRKKIQ